MYFDKDGIVVESSTDVYENVPEIDGLKFDSIVINNKLDVGNSEIYNTILALTQSFVKYDINVLFLIPHTILRFIWATLR